MTYFELKTTIETLHNTAIEKVNVLGVEDASGYINAMVNIANDLIEFWSDVTTIDEDIDLQNIIIEIEKLIVR